jgi:hypothetical protein
MNRCVAALLFALPLAAGGCASPRTDTFNIEIRNDTKQPLTLSLAKDGPPFESAWATPEEIAVESPKLREKWSGGPTGMALLPPGKTASIKGLTGIFNARTKGYLRAYAGDCTISQMSARSPGSPDRLDVPLTPGDNRLVIVEDATRIVAKPAQ